MYTDIGQDWSLRQFGFTSALDPRAGCRLFGWTEQQSIDCLPSVALQERELILDLE
jgi:hypothetical protein